MEMTCFELDEAEAHKADARARQLGVTASIRQEDFLGWAITALQDDQMQKFDAVVGNPPFIRYQYLPSWFQARASSIFRHLGCAFTKHTNAWVPFVLASLALLKPGGRLAMVIPTEVLHLLHAQGLRSCLIRECSRVLVLDPQEIWFDGTLQGAVLLMAEKAMYPDAERKGVAITAVRGRAWTGQDPEAMWRAARYVQGAAVSGKWTRALLPGKILDILDTVKALPSIHQCGEIAKVSVGIVTGANDFFVVGDSVVTEYGLADWAHPMCSRSAQVPGIIYDQMRHAEAAARGKPLHLLWFPDTAAGEHPSVRAYVAHGERLGLHTRFKCRVRSPWYAVPSVHAADVGLFKRSHDAPRLVLNRLGAFTTDSIYRMRPLLCSASTLACAFLNPLTALTAELEGRTYGGGVLEMVPSEIRKLLVPVPTGGDNGILDVDALDGEVSSSPMDAVMAGHGQRVLAAAGVEHSDASCILDAWSMLRSRRQRNSDAVE